MRDQSGNYLAVIKVVGTGGGSNAVNRMVEAGLRGCEFIAVNTDAQALLMVEADQKIHIGAAATRGLGAGADPQKGYEAAMETRDELKEGTEEVPTWCSSPPARRGHGYGLGPGHRRDRARAWRAPVGVVTRPFGFEGGRRAEQAQAGIGRLRDHVDTLIIIPNDRLLQVVEKQTPLGDAFRMADESSARASRESRTRSRFRGSSTSTSPTSGRS